MGFADIGPFGAKGYETPHLDRMAAEGMRFTQFLAGGNVCAPTRSTLMTGLHTGHTTIRTNGGGLSLCADDITLARVLQDAGYATGGFGKWGCGGRGGSMGRRMPNSSPRRCAKRRGSVMAVRTPLTRKVRVREG